MKRVLAMLLLVGGCAPENIFDRGEGDGLLAPGGDPGSGDLSFAADVAPLLDPCIACHAGGAGGSNYTGDAAQLLPVVDLEDPAASELLMKASGAVTHGGGVFYAASSPQYAILLGWIEAGAAD